MGKNTKKVSIVAMLLLLSHAVFAPKAPGCCSGLLCCFGSSGQVAQARTSQGRPQFALANKSADPAVLPPLPTSPRVSFGVQAGPLSESVYTQSHLNLANASVQAGSTGQPVGTQTHYLSIDMGTDAARVTSHDVGTSPREATLMHTGTKAAPDPLRDAASRKRTDLELVVNGQQKKLKEVELALARARRELDQERNQRLEGSRQASQQKGYIEHLEGQAQIKQSKIRALESELKRLESVRRELTETLEKAKSAHAAALEEVSKAQVDNRNLVTTVAELEERIRLLTAELENGSGKGAGLRPDTSHAKSSTCEIGIGTDVLQSTNTKPGVEKSGVEALQQRIAALENELAQLKHPASNENASSAPGKGAGKGKAPAAPKAAPKAKSQSAPKNNKLEIEIERLAEEISKSGTAGQNKERSEQIVSLKGRYGAEKCNGDLTPLLNALLDYRVEVGLIQRNTPKEVIDGYKKASADAKKSLAQYLHDQGQLPPEIKNMERPIQNYTLRFSLGGDLDSSINAYLTKQLPLDNALEIIKRNKSKIKDLERAQRKYTQEQQEPKRTLDAIKKDAKYIELENALQRERSTTNQDKIREDIKKYIAEQEQKRLYKHVVCDSEYKKYVQEIADTAGDPQYRKAMRDYQSSLLPLKLDFLRDLERKTLAEAMIAKGMGDLSSVREKLKEIQGQSSSINAFAEAIEGLTDVNLLPQEATKLIEDITKDGEAEDKLDQAIKRLAKVINEAADSAKIPENLEKGTKEEVLKKFKSLAKTFNEVLEHAAQSAIGLLPHEVKQAAQKPVVGGGQGEQPAIRPTLDRGSSAAVLIPSASALQGVQLRRTGSAPFELPNKQEQNGSRAGRGWNKKV